MRQRLGLGGMSEGPVYNAELKVKARVEVHGAMSRD
jgi:hypothetical protein